MRVESAVRAARVGSLVGPEVIARDRARRVEATAVILAGPEALEAYLAELAGHADEFADWDGRVRNIGPDGEPMHRVLVVDRYGQVYAAVDGREATELPSAAALAEWFRFLATACPECGVIDDPLAREFVP